jgi:hypothetical protein
MQVTDVNVGIYEQAPFQEYFIMLFTENHPGIPFFYNVEDGDFIGDGQKFFFLSEGFSDDIVSFLANKGLEVVEVVRYTYSVTCRKFFPSYDAFTYCILVQKVGVSK